MKKRTSYDWFIIGVYVAFGGVGLTNHLLSKHAGHNSMPYIVTMFVLLSVTQINRAYDAQVHINTIGPFKFLGMVLGLAVFLILLLIVLLSALGV